MYANETLNIPKTYLGDITNYDIYLSFSNILSMFFGRDSLTAGATSKYHVFQSQKGLLICVCFIQFPFYFKQFENIDFEIKNFEAKDKFHKLI